MERIGVPLADVLRAALGHTCPAAALVRVDDARTPGRYDLAAQDDSAPIPPQGEFGGPNEKAVGNFATVFAAAPVTVDESYSVPDQAHCMMEPHATIARWDGNRVTCWSSIQQMDWGTRDLAAVLGIPRENVRLISPLVGGGFGDKGTVQADLALAAMAAHTHPLGQSFYFTEGCGWTQRENGPVERVCAGDTVTVPAGAKHWHGATATKAMSHLAITETLDGKNVEWLGPVTDAKYADPAARQGPSTRNPSLKETSMTQEPTNARNAFGDAAPHLAEITDKVLFGDIWADPALSPRDRSLITVTSLISLYRTNELPFHLKKALENGVTKDEIVAIITHLAFYAGWPPAMTALQIARTTFDET